MIDDRQLDCLVTVRSIFKTYIFEELLWYVGTYLYVYYLFTILQSHKGKTKY